MLEPKEAKDRLIVALDVSSRQKAEELVEGLKGVVSFFKVTPELFTVAGPEFLTCLKKQNLKVFLDIKMNDVDETIRRTVKVVADLGVDFFTIHGNGATAQAALEGKGCSDLKILSVTLLTSLDEQELRDLGLIGRSSFFNKLNLFGNKFRFETLDDYMLWRAEQAISNGCDGLITSGLNAGLLRSKFPNAILVCPGIRLEGQGHDEHKRACTPAYAIRNGADYLVVGRPIKNAPSPREMALRIIDEIETALRGNLGNGNSTTEPSYSSSPKQTKGGHLESAVHV